MKLAIFCDFDETITRTNVTDSVLDRFADHRWMEIQKEWLAGRLSAREVLEQQMPLVTVTSEELEAFVDSVQVIVSSKSQKMAIVRADRRLDYGRVVRVLGICRASGFYDIGIAVK